MNWTKRAEEPRMDETELLDAEMKQALGDFKASVHAWSDAEYLRPRAIHASATRRVQRLAMAWSLAGVLLAAGTTGSIYVAHDRQQAAAVAAAHEAERQREQAAEQVKLKAKQEEEVLASVDTAVSRTVPSAMEPLADLMDESGTGY